MDAHPYVSFGHCRACTSAYHREWRSRRAPTCDVCGQPGTRAATVTPGRGMLAHKACRPAPPSCAAPLCDRASHARGLCITHWTREYGRGSLPLDAPLQQGGNQKQTASTWERRPSGKYIKVKTPDGWIEEHRLVALRTLGVWAEDAPCHDCGRVMAREIHHVDEDPHNNDPSNLRALCSKCHNARHTPAAKRWAS